MNPSKEMMSEYIDDAKKAPTPTLDGGSVETGEPVDRYVVEGGRPVGDSQATTEGKVSKAFGNDEFSTLNLSPENILNFRQKLQNIVIRPSLRIVVLQMCLKL